MRRWIFSGRRAGASLLLGLLAALLFVSASAQAQPAANTPADDPYANDPGLSVAEEARYRALIKNLRCLVCQNESLADSDAPLAADLRTQVRGMIAKGQSNDQVRKYLTDRYGDFVLYRPPFQANTWLLWLGPFALALLGLIVLATFLRRTRRRAQPAAVDEAALKKILEERS